MRIVYKYPVSFTDTFTLELPEGALVLSIQTQKRGTFLWALVDPNAKVREVSFMLVDTGKPIIEDSIVLKYVNTVQLEGGEVVFHLFEIIQ